MISGPALENLVVSVGETCRLGLEPDELRRRVLPRLRRAVPIDALWWASVDPATLLFTGPYREDLPADTTPYFVENEFLHDDANKWTELARDPGGVRTLLEATGGALEKSARYRDIFQPLGLADEHGAVLRSGGVTWGFMCLHREGPAGFSAAETQFVQRIAPHFAEGIRLGLLIGSLSFTPAVDGPGLLLLAEDGSLAGAPFWCAVARRAGRAEGRSCSPTRAARRRRKAARVNNRCLDSAATMRSHPRRPLGRLARFLARHRAQGGGDHRAGGASRGRPDADGCLWPHRTGARRRWTGLPGSLDQ